MKGQIFSMDFMLSLGIFLFILSSSIVIWNNINSQIDQREANNKLQTEIVSISTLLLETPGSPVNWEEDPSKTSQLGLAVKGNLLSSAKILALTNIPYNDAKNLLGLEDEDIYIEFIDANGNLLQAGGKDMKFGLEPQNAGNIYSISRAVVIDNNSRQMLGTMKVILWQR